MKRSVKYGSQRFNKNNRLRFFTTKKNAGRYSSRIVKIGGGSFFEGEEEETSQTVFVDNSIKSSKYTVLTFLPCNLFFQFRRFGNFYFLIIAVLQLLIDSPVSPITSISPLVFVVAVTMIKQGYEDYKRHRSDTQINNKMVTQLKNGIIKSVYAKKIRVGDVIQVHEGEEFPCDLVLLSSSDSRGRAHVMTANLDGETNLKVRASPKATQNLRLPEEIGRFRGRIECENPNSDLSRFVGRLSAMGSMPEALTQDNICLRGTSLVHTEFVFGCAVYTGQDTKMSRNSKTTPTKFSTVELSLNRYLLFFVALLLGEVTVATVLRFTEGVDLSYAAPTPWYLGKSLSFNVRQVLQDCLSFLILFNYVVPISLYVTLEFQKFVGSLFFTWDLNLFDPDSGQAPICNSSDLNEELGQVEYLFSDKTGTLTENIMIFKQCSIEGKRFIDSSSELCFIDEEGYDTRRVDLFLKSLALCHTVEVDIGGNGKDFVYNASSPDEKAIVDACRKFGVTFMEGIGEYEDQEILRLVIRNEIKELIFHRIIVLEFDSERKCMSVIVRDQEGTVRVISKGAESSILPKCTSGLIDQTRMHVDMYGSIGLRTLVVSERILTESELDGFIFKLKEASISLTNRSNKIKEVYQEIESNMRVLGAVAIEDKLQEGVKETLVSLGEAGIKIWILTGDKKETALNISQSCGHYDPSLMRLLDLCKEGVAVGNSINEYLRVTRVSDNRNCLIIDGRAVKSLFAFKDSIELFRCLALRCRSVICCRMSPLQKADIVRLIKNSPETPVTASIGDGGNDVSMIQEAHVGFGIMGLEGRAAVRASDFAFGKFRFLQRVLLVHGHWYYVRVAVLVHYFFYKNIVAFTPQLIYAFFNNFSTQTLYDGVNLTLYNIVFTSLPIFLYGLMEQNVSAHMLLRRPHLYRKITRNALLDFKNFLLWFAGGVWHSCIIFFIYYWLNDETDASRIGFGLGIYQAAIVVVSLRLLIQSRFWNGYLLGGVIISLATFLIFTFTYHSLLVPPFFSDGEIKQWIPLNPATHGEIFNIMSRPRVWVGWILCAVSCLIPDIAVLALKKSFKDILGIITRLERKFGKESFNLADHRLYDVDAYTNMAFVIDRE